MAEVLLTRGMVAIVDDCDLEFLSQFTWHANKTVKDKWYAKTTVWINGVQRHIAMHRTLLGAKPGELVDHENGDSLDNRSSSNLRFSNTSRNNWNSKPRKTKKHSKFKGVCFHNGKWRVAITPTRGNRINVGSFLSEVDAARAYDTAALHHFGEFARTNQMLGLYDDA